MGRSKRGLRDSAAVSVCCLAVTGLLSFIFVISTASVGTVVFSAKRQFRGSNFDSWVGDILGGTGNVGNFVTKLTQVTAGIPLPLGSFENVVIGNPTVNEKAKTLALGSLNPRDWNVYSGIPETLGRNFKLPFCRSCLVRVSEVFRKIAVTWHGLPVHHTFAIHRGGRTYICPRHNYRNGSDLITSQPRYIANLPEEKHGSTLYSLDVFATNPVVLVHCTKLAPVDNRYDRPNKYADSLNHMRRVMPPFRNTVYAILSLACFGFGFFFSGMFLFFSGIHTGKVFLWRRIGSLLLAFIFAFHGLMFMLRAWSCNLNTPKARKP